MTTSKQEKKFYFEKKFNVGEHFCVLEGPAAMNNWLIIIFSSSTIIVAAIPRRRDEKTAGPAKRWLGAHSGVFRIPITAMGKIYHTLVLHKMPHAHEVLIVQWCHDRTVIIIRIHNTDIVRNFKNTPHTRLRRCLLHSIDLGCDDRDALLPVAYARAHTRYLAYWTFWQEEIEDWGHNY